MATRKIRIRETDRDLLRIATFILFDAAVFQEALAGTHAGIDSLRKARGSLHAFLDGQWEKILKVDYTPVFSLAREVLRAFPSSPDTEAMLSRVVETALDAVSSGVLLRHDFMGRVYHRLLLRTTGHFYATYYTSIPAAWLLANLALKSPHPSWNLSSLEGIGRFRVLDPACGSGTLLSAAYMAIKDLYILARPARLDLSKLHRVLLEQVFHGWDILDYASHLTLTTLALHSNRITVRDSNVYTVPAGIDSEQQVRLGSLDYLRPQQPLVGRGFSAPALQLGLSGDRERIIPLSPGECGLVIMNPPFSRSAKPNVKFGYSTERVRIQMAKALSKMAREIGATGIGQAGLGAYFMLLALRMVKDDGRIAIVIPRSMLSGVSWTKVRVDYLRECEIEYIVSNYDPGNSDEGIEPWCWSENTHLGEVLIVARKVRGGTTAKPCIYVNLWHKPKNEVEALLVSHQVIRAQARLRASILDKEWEPLVLHGRSVGSVYQITPDHLSRNWLGPCVFAHPELNVLVMACMSEAMPCVPLGQVAGNFGVDIKQVKDHFVRADRPTSYAIVWGHQAAMNTIRVAPENVGFGRATRKEASANLHAAGSSTLLIAERPHLSTEALLAMESPESVLTTAFWEVRAKESVWAWPIVLWMNSTYGFLQYLACATSSMGDIFKMKKEQLQATPVLDPTRLARAELRELWKNTVLEPFLPFGEEFARAAANKGPRYLLDQFFRTTFRLPELTPAHYALLARDPIITKKRL